MTGANSGEDGDNDLFLVDCGVETLKDVYLNLPKLYSLNLHSNYITRIENLTALPALTRLDLSSNQILRIEGLKYLTNLKHLNLSCNLITIVEGLTTLSSLMTINLSYNQIVNLSGFRRFPVANNLTTVQLQGNGLSDINHIILSLRSCQHLTYLVLHDGPSSTNPICSNTNYGIALKEQLPALISTEKPPAESYNSVSSEQYNAVIPADSKTSMLTTPRIDAVLERFHNALDNRQLSTSTTATSTPRDTETEGVVTPTQQVRGEPSSHDAQKKALELQLEQLEKELLRKKIESTEIELQQLKQNSPKKVPERSTDQESVASNLDSERFNHRRENSNNNNVSKTPVHKKPATRRTGPGRPTRVSGQAGRQATSNTTDVLYRDAVNSTYQQLMKDLDLERLRRSKAEEAASKLAQQLKSYESESNDQQLARRNCDDAIKKLKRDLAEAREAQGQAADVAAGTETRCKELENESKRLRKTCGAQEKSIRHLEQVQERLEQLRSETEVKYREEADKMSKTVYEQTELLRASQVTVQSQRAELEDMKSLLAARESDHRREMEHRYALDSPKLEELFQSKITSLVREQAAERKEYEYRLEQSTNDYSELENEFRLALQIEADRFQSLKTAFQDLSDNQSTQEKVLLACKDKDSRSSKVITDITQLVKEQKDKIISLSKEKQDLSQRTQAAKARLEQQVANLDNKIKDHERLKRDNIELKNQVQGQHSIISGLRKERELWCKELAQQGASLSNERGTLEAKVETLTQENKTLRSNIETEVDTVKIKTKLISDLTDTVSTLKQKLSQAETENTNKESQLQNIKSGHLKELEEEKSHNADLEQEVDALVKRKEELKSQLQSAEDELSEVRESHRNLKAKWQDKSSSISTLEDQVKQMRDGWIEKEKKLMEERDKAIQAADLALQRMKTADDGFRKQLDAKELSHDEEMQELKNQLGLRIAEEQHRVERVEEEMRELLTERDQSKKQLDSRVKRLSQALLDLQQEGAG